MYKKTRKINKFRKWNIFYEKGVDFWIVQIYNNTRACDNRTVVNLRKAPLAQLVEQ